MPVLGLTGGIATGKTTVAPLLLSRLPGTVYFDSDRCVHNLLADDDTIRDLILEAFGTSVLDENGRPSRPKLREVVFADESRRKTLESILHPAVRASWTSLVKQSKADSGWLLVDIPLLYETGVQKEFDRVIVVGCPPATQLKRLNLDRGLALELAARIMASQLDIGTKTQQADHVIWNDSTVSNLDGQSQFLAAWLKQHYG